MKLRNVLLGLTATIAMYSCSGSNLPVQAAATPVTVEKAAIPALFAGQAIVPGTNIDLSATGLNVNTRTLTAVNGGVTSILADLINSANGGKVYFSITGKGSLSSNIINDGSSVEYTAPAVGESSTINVFFIDNGVANVIQITVNSVVTPPPQPINMPPQVDVFIATPAVGNKPSNVVFNMAVSDPTLPADTLTCTLDYGDGSPVYTGPCVATKNHIYTVVGSYNAKLTVSDGVNAPVSKVIVVTVNANVAPVINQFTATPSVGSGSLATVFTVNVSDATTNPADTLTCTVAYGDGTANYGPGPCLPTLNHTYMTAGTYTATLTVSDGVNAPVTKSISIVVNLALKVTSFTATTTPPTFNVATNYAFSGGTAPYTCVVNWDTTNAVDLTVYPGFQKMQTISPCTSPALLNKTYPFAGKFIANFKVTDSVGAMDSRDVTINMNGTNNNPFIQIFTVTIPPSLISPPVVPNLSSTFTNGNADVANPFAPLTYSGPSSQIFTVTTKATDIDPGDLITCKVNGVVIPTCDNNVMVTAPIPAQPGLVPFVFRVDDNFGGFAQQTINVAYKSIPAQLLTANQLVNPLTGLITRKVSVKANAADGDGDDLTCVLDFGDGAVITYFGCQNFVPLSNVHTYSAVAVATTYTITLKVTDSDGNVAPSTSQSVTINPGT